MDRSLLVGHAFTRTVRDFAASRVVQIASAALVLVPTAAWAVAGRTNGWAGHWTAGLIMTGALLAFLQREHRERLRATDEAARMGSELVDRLADARYRTMFERADVGVALLDLDGHIRESNVAFERMLLPTERRQLAEELTAEAGAEEDGSSHCERRFYRAGGDVAWFDVVLSPIDDAAFDPVRLCLVNEITARKLTEERWRFDATHDALTGLANRVAFESHLRAAFENAAQSPFALFFVDLDGFKYINDTFGHHAGDMVIALVGKRLRASVNASDVVARFGGDEFAILVRGVARSEVAMSIAERMHNNVTVPFKVEGRPVAINASIGIVLSSEHYPHPEHLMRDADTAMFGAKATRSGYLIFDAAQQVVDNERLEIQSDLLTALGRDEFFIVYQPISRLADGVPLGYEALLRWRHPKQGVIMPGVFIPLLEQVGLIRSVGQWMIRVACAEFASLRAANAAQPSLFLHLNVSVQELFAREFLNNLLLAVATHRLSPNNIIIEITESGMLETGERTDNVLARLKEHGFGLCIDDFGTGYSSLQYLQRLQLDSIKIDRTFIAGEAGGIGSEAIVKTLVTLAEAFGVGIIAEGVETLEQRSFLRRIGCTTAQGYLFGRPQTVSDLAIPPGRN